MTTNDLTERIRDEIAGHPIGSGYYQTAVGSDEAADIAAAVLPIVEAEVRKAKAEALREAVRDMGEWADEGLVVTGDEHDESTWLERTVGEFLTDRATEYETGDRA